MCNKCESAVSRNAELKENLISIKCGNRHQKFHHRKLPAHLSSICQSIVMKYFQNIFDIRSGRRRTTSSSGNMCSMKSISSFNVLLFVIFSSVLLVPNMVKCTVLEEFGQTLQRSLGNVEIEDITIEQLLLEPISASPDSKTSDENWGDKYNKAGFNKEHGHQKRDNGKFRKKKNNKSEFQPF